ncbi:MAG: MarR family winged helix-turn-helix transcriptional regulator [Bacillota bacterium]
MSKAAISRTVTSLESKGLVTRRKDTSDQRSYRLFLTERARQEEAFIQEQYAKIVAAATAGVPQQKVTEFTALLARVADNLENYTKSRQAANHNVH